MKKLTLEQFKMATAFVNDYARPVNRALFRYYFEDAPVESVSVAIQKYQNDDGGFGHAIEPDFRLPDSSPIATCVAFEYLTEIGTTAKNDNIASAVRYFVESYDPSVCGWDCVPAQINEYPHAPWWKYDAAEAEEYLRTRWANPSAQIVGYLHAYREIVPEELLDEVTQKAMTMLANSGPELTEHDYLCYIRMAGFLPAELAGRVWGILKKRVPSAIATRPEQWSGYGVRPLTAAPIPTSPLLDVLDQAISAQLDFEIEQQQPDGSWHPYWAWGQFEQEWETAKVEWQGKITVAILMCLDRFGRIERS